MPCRGCYGAPEGVVDQGAKMLSTLASIVDAPTPEEIAEIAATVPDPVGTFYRFGLASSLLEEGEGLNEKGKRRSHHPARGSRQDRDLRRTTHGEVANVYFQIPELRGFERFCVGRPVEELARITPRICGVCPEAHHMAATKAIDGVFGVEPAPAGRKLRELLYNAFYVTDHTTHFYILAGPDFIMGPESDPAGAQHPRRDRQGRPRDRRRGASTCAPRPPSSSA